MIQEENVTLVLKDDPSWTSFEITKLIVGAATPLVIAFFGYQISSQSEARAEHLAQFERVTEKRVELWDDLGPKLNDIYAYLLYVGDWQSMDSKFIVRKKREADRLFYSYQPFFSPEFSEVYQAFMDEAFTVYNGMGEDAKPNTSAIDRRGQSPDLVSGQENSDRVHKTYYRLLDVVAEDFRLAVEEPEGRPMTPAENRAEQ